MQGFLKMGSGPSDLFLILEKGTSSEIEMRLDEAPQSVARFAGVNVRATVEISSSCWYKCVGTFKSFEPMPPSQKPEPFLYPPQRPHPARPCSGHL